MAPKVPYKVHSLNKHIQNTQKGVSAEAQFNSRPASRGPIVKRDPDSIDPNNIFKNNGNNDDDDEEESSDSSSSSDDEGNSNFLTMLGASRVKTSTTPARRRNNKDVEIADSDDDRNAAAKPASAAKKAAILESDRESSDDSSSESESESEESEAKPKTNGVALTKASDSSSTSSSGSESESESEEDTKKPTATKPDESSSEESSDSESESESEVEPKPKANPNANGNTVITTTASSDSSEESESEDEDEDSDKEVADESMHIEHRQDRRQVAVPNFIAPDFVLRKGEDGANGKDVAEICNQANLDGKQFWYFTVPSNVPISVVQNLEIPMDSSQQGSTIFSHNGEDYGVSFGSIAPKGNIQILIPSSNGSQYRSASQQINQVMQVKKITQLANFPTAEIGPAPKRTPRPQPENLVGRYQPLGVKEANTGDDIEMTEAATLSEQSKALNKKEKKRKDKEASSQTPVTEKTKKQKKQRESVIEPPSSITLPVSTPDVSRKGKRKHTPSEEDAAAAAEQLIEENKSAANKSKKQKTNPTGSPDLGSETPSRSTRRQTPVLPPTFSQPILAPSSSQKSRKSKETKVELPVLSSHLRQTPIPIPSIPHSSQSRADPAHVASPSVTKEEKRAKKRKEKESKKSKELSEHSGGRKVTPVPPPTVGSSS